jgi:hypothetical protein
MPGQKRAFALDVPDIQVFAPLLPDSDGRDGGKRKRRRPLDGFARQ